MLLLLPMLTAPQKLNFSLYWNRKRGPKISEQVLHSISNGAISKLSSHSLPFTRYLVYFSFLQSDFVACMWFWAWCERACVNCMSVCAVNTKSARGSRTGKLRYYMYIDNIFTSYTMKNEHDLCKNRTAYKTFPVYRQREREKTAAHGFE